MLETTPPDLRLYLDDLFVGQTFVSDAERVTKEDITQFATAFDPQPFHLNEDDAKRSIFAGLAASGWHTAALTMRLLVEGGLPIDQGIVGAGAELTWPKAVRPDDTLNVKTTVLSISPSKTKSDRGIVMVECETLNQYAEVVQRAVIKLLVFRRGV